jgi:hypothetical protein
LGKGPFFYHAYDQNFAFGASATGLNLGEGSPTYGVVEWNAKLPALWHLPDGTWAWTPDVEWKLASQPNALLPHDLGEAWYWPKYHETLRSWAERFWAADRATLDDDLVREILKTIRNQAMGLLGHERKQDAGQVVDDLYRPDIWALLVSKTRARTEFTKRRLASQGFVSCWTKADEVGFVSNNPDWRTAVPIAQRKNVVTGEVVYSGDKLGGYKHSCTLPYDEELVYAFSDACPWDEADDTIERKQRLQKIARTATTLVPAVSHG